MSVSISGTPLRIGIDLDNTLIDYDRVFCELAFEHGLRPSDHLPNRIAIREALRTQGREDLWTRLQGEAYGEKMQRAVPSEGVVQFLSDCLRRQACVWIVSHRSRQPFSGPACDLHAAAYSWLEDRGILDTLSTGLSHAHVFLETSPEQKIARISELGCTHFVDDLPEFLTRQDFPSHVVRVLFDPHRQYQSETHILRAESWSEVIKSIDGTRIAFP